jgi:SHS2 domain-containing protein
LYEYLEHPSDIIVLAKNDSFEHALEDIAEGMFGQMGAAEADESHSINIEFSEKTVEQLVVQLLTEIIAECETIPLTPKRMEVTSFQAPVSSGQEYKISVRVFGEKKVPENIIKAVTYNSLRIEKKENNWEIEVLFDI